MSFIVSYRDKSIHSLYLTFVVIDGIVCACALRFVLYEEIAMPVSYSKGKNTFVVGYVQKYIRVYLVLSAHLLKVSQFAFGY